MLRTALKPRWLRLFALVVVIGVVFTELGLWQLHVAQDKDAAAAISRSATRPPVPISSYLSPHKDFPADGSGRLVTMTGSYAASRQELVADRRLDGASGFWVVTPLTDPASGATLAVVRGFVTTAAAAPAPPSGTVGLTGSLAPGESPSALAGLPAGQIGAVDLSVLVNQWPGSLYNAFVFATSETVAGQPAPLGAMSRVPPPSPTGGGLQWRNAAYAFQWWVFALFAVWMWGKMVREDWLVDNGRRDAEQPVPVGHR
ncbi:MAG: SURF1 family protein [Nostocoides sp.]